MLRWTLLVLAVVLAGAASLTWFRAPTIWLWMTSILVGEFGHFLFLLPVAVGGCAWVWGGELRVVIIGICVVAAVGMWRPVVLAAVIGQTLPAKLGSAFGKVEMNRAPFSLGGLVARSDEPVAVETRDVAAGLPMDFYRAVGRTKPAPCVVMIHGGGWDSGDRGQLPAVNHHLARLGYAVAAVSYRLAPATVWPGQADDVVAAITYLKAHAAELGIDPTRLVLMGRSAGGQIASSVGYGRPDPAVRGVVSFYGPHDQVFAWGFSREDDILNAVKLLRQYLGGSPDEAPEAYRTASAYLIATKENALPTLMVHGEMDSMVWNKQSERLHAKLDGLGVPNAFVSLPWATHACDFNPHGPSGQLAWYSLEWFLAAVTK
ncbi:alpha/beta hydrolase [Rariglobus hedericola]|uniref:Alpha/beta hydrolase n=1 Tax=Rariglobus hedericola TaxID=2597822 RepID=A0A556QS17_9BACT|nr:alpha/beta hydrolase [Rariglobus hedericola]TSJ79436.1 alpha/beta hydrolase [Rariglobus hedericola]